MLSMFSRRKEQEVQGFVVKLVNNNCPELKALIEGPRKDARVPLTVIVLVTPMEGRTPRIEKTFAAATKELSFTGVSLVLPEPRAVDEVILAFRNESDMKFIRAQARHLNPLGAGYYQLGVEMLEVVAAGDYPGLSGLAF